MRKKEVRVGAIQIAQNGQTMKIIEYIDNKNITVEFEDGTIVKNKQLVNFKNGTIRNPNKPLLNTKKAQKRIGENIKANNGQYMTIVEYKDKNHIDVIFEDGTIVQNKTYNNFKNGLIKNPNFKKETV